MVTVHRALSIVLSIVALLGLGSGGAWAGDAECKAILEAVTKQASLPVRQKGSMESAQAPGRKFESEMVRTADTLYLHMNGQWHKRPYDPAKTVADAREAMSKSKHSCELVRREQVNGQLADLYKVHSEGPQGTSDAEMWIGVTSGLPLRQRTQMTPPSGTKMQHDVTYEYGNVKTPIP